MPGAWFLLAQACVPQRGCSWPFFTRKKASEASLAVVQPALQHSLQYRSRLRKSARLSGMQAAIIVLFDVSAGSSWQPATGALSASSLERTAGPSFGCQLH